MVSLATLDLGPWASERHHQKTIPRPMLRGWELYLSVLSGGPGSENALSSSLEEYITGVYEAGGCSQWSVRQILLKNWAILDRWINMSKYSIFFPPKTLKPLIDKCLQHTVVRSICAIAG